MGTPPERAGSLLLLLLLALEASAYYDPFANQARLYNEGGHLFIVGAENRNITIRTSGKGYINLNDLDLLFITKMAKKSSDFMDNFRTSVLPGMQGPVGWSDEKILARIRRLEIAVNGANSTGLVTALSRVVRAMRLLLTNDECESFPCQNGGTCVDMFNGFQCRCTPGYQGAACEKDVNECELFADTNLGCKNGGTCRNVRGSYYCTCPPGWYGLHCSERSVDCTLQSSAELCGHGICVNQGGTGRGFVCICNEGWTANEGDGTCTLDKDECAGPHRPCSHDPFVECHNTPGSFACGPCPKGYTGNGYQCSDINECEVNNSGCSTSPAVDCINLRGSRLCGPCPAGYVGDGISCTQSGRCKQNNGGCHPLATCRENPVLHYVECQCPIGYSGLGVGANGCLPSTTNSVCASSDCLNGGTCIPLGADRYICQCRPPYTGPVCNDTADACSSAPCKNGGTCKVVTFSSHVDYYRCACPVGYDGRNCEIKREGCLASFFGSGGSVVWPTDNSTITTGYRPITCAWKITTSHEKVINLTFTSMNMISLKSGSTCLYNYVEVYDGSSSSAVQLAHFCGPPLPGPIVSTFPSLYITGKFPSNKGVLKFNWTAVEPQCGGILNASRHGSFASPGSPGRYPKNAHCVWKLFTFPGQRIQLTFFSMDIENHQNCNFDYLEIRSGDSESSPLLRRLCNSTLPPPLTTPSYTATVTFHSDSTRDGKGFQIAYSSREGVPGCGGTLTSPSGSISPPAVAGESAYQEGLKCDWLIELPHSERIMLVVNSFSIEKSTGCQYDSLEVYDGPTKDNGLMGRWCGEASIPPLTSTSNIVLVSFSSDYTMNEGGFVLNYVAVCGGTWSGSDGVITSPYYPSHYPEDRECTYTIERPVGNAIRLDFSDFDLEESEDCMYDKLQIYDGNDQNSPLLGEFCGNKKPGQIISSHNFIFMVLVTDSTRQSHGFKANYSSFDISCGGILTGFSGTLSSPRYPEQYPASQLCRWIIATKPGTVIRLNWLAFHVAHSHLCTRDWVKIFDNNTVASMAGQLGDRYCGNTLPPIMTSTSNIMTIIFSTDGSDSEPGFSASYTAINSSNVCGANYFTTAGEIYSPNFPNGYPNNLDCRWVITAPEGQQIRLSSESFSLERHNECLNDYLEIRNGGHETSPLVGKYCGTVLNVIISTTHQLFLRFVTDVDQSEAGFKLIWDAALTGCGGGLTAPSGAILSPNYPQPYGRNTECAWKISVSQGSRIRLVIIDLALEDHPRCSLDYLEVFDGGNRHSPRLAKLCSTSPSTIDSTANKMFIRFRSDSSRQATGFNLKYDTVCNVTLKGYRGIIESPGFPNFDRIPKHCLWTIDAPLGNRVNLTFTHYIKEMLERRNDSGYPRVSIYDGSLAANSEISYYSSETHESRGIISSRSNKVYVDYIIHPILIDRPGMFRIEWSVSGCGGIFKNQKKGVITSPNYPKSYPHSTHCEWYIAVHYGNSIKITIDYLQIENVEDCVYDALEIHGGPDESSPSLAKLCRSVSSQSPTVLTTSGNQAFIRFRADSSYSGRGFHASYGMVPSACGGEFLSSSGSIHSHNYPQNYDSHDDCGFLVKVDPTHTVNLTFIDFDIGSIDSNCTMGYVKVYDGDSEEAALLQTLCGNKLPPNIISSQNVLYIRHKADGFTVAKGFYAKYHTGCGAILETDSSGTINYAELNSTMHFENEYKCKWIIRSKLPDAKIRLSFALLEVVTSDLDNPVNASLSILAGEGDDAPVFWQYAQTRLPPPVVVPSTVVTVLFSKVQGVEHGRFIIDYSVLDTACGGTLITEAGTIASPSYPDPYPSNAECIWILVVAPGNKMELQFNTFELEDSESCNEDYVEIRAVSESGALFGAYCGKTVPERITSNGTLWIKFKSSSEGSAGGFEADMSLAMNNELEGFAGSIASPLYPLPYLLASTYTWRISVRIRHVIRFAFTDFYAESHNGASDDVDQCYNSLVFYDGYDDSAPVLKTLCGIERPEPFTSGSNTIYMVMRSVFQASQTQFLLNWMQMEKLPPTTTTTEQEENCTTVVELRRGRNSSYHFESAGFPLGYAHNTHCEWIFQAPVGSHVVISFTTLNLEYTSSCSADAVTIYNGESRDSWVESERLCSENATARTYPGSRLLRLVFTTDHSVNRTGFSGTATAVCGGSISGEARGLISEGGYSRCEWNITVRPGRTIAINFSSFLVRGTPPCKDNYIILRDGGSADSPLIGQGKYCGDSKPVIPNTHGNRLYIKYVSETTEGFNLTFEEKSLDCGGVIMLSEGYDSEVIASPNYPNVPPAHIECFWQVLAPSGESVVFEVTRRFDMTWSKGCSSEYVELRDGSTELSPLIGRYCHQTPSFVTSEGNALLIKYFTDTEVPKDGFTARVTISKCGGTIYPSYGENGTILSPGYPEPYEGNLNCTWKLVARPQGAIYFNITYSLGNSFRRPCNKSSQDTLTVTEITNGVNTSLEGPETMVFCGQSAASIVSEMDEVLINFLSLKQPAVRRKRNFMIVYQESRKSCGGSLKWHRGRINSPNYPASYEGRTYCTWKITVPAGKRVTFTVTDLDLVPGNNRTRPQWLSFSHGFRSNTIAVLTGTQSKPTVIESSGNKMMLTYRSVYKTNHRGFIGNFSSDLPALCGGSIVTETPRGSIQVDSTILAKNKSFSCEWELTSPSTQPTTITLFFEGELNLAKLADPECYYSGSRLLFLDINSKLTGDFCGVTKPNRPYAVSKPNDRTLIQAAKSIWSRHVGLINFSLKWKVDVCGGTYKLSSPLTISSPGNDTFYPSDTDCVWSISAPEGTSIKVHFTKFDLGDDCEEDYLRIHNGGTPLAPVVSRRCGEILPADIITQSSHVWIHFHSGATQQHKRGFSLQLSQSDTSCGGVLHLRNGQISSPGYPSNYENNIECDWELQSPIGFHIGITFADRFFIEGSSDCSRDFVQVFDYVDDAWSPKIKLCGRDPSMRTFNSTSNRMRVLFRSNNNVTGDGFKAIFNWNCGSKIEVTEKGHIYSPGWPRIYPPLIDCNYSLVAPGKIITLRPETFQLESATSVEGCFFDKVQFFTRQRDYVSVRSSGVYCGKSLPPPQTSVGQLDIRFTTDGYINYKGFHFVYSISNCGGEITEETVILGTDIDAQNYQVTTCRWNVTAPADRIVRIKISDLTFSRTINCHLEYLAIYDVSNISTNGTLLGKVCGVIRGVPAYFKSSGNRMKIVLVSFDHDKTQALRLIVSFGYGSKSGCGGEISLNQSESSIINPDIDRDGRYDDNMDCVWTFSTIAGNTVLLSFDKMDLKPCRGNTTISTCCDYLEVYDGASINTNKIGTYCSQTLPRSISSSRSYLTVRFITDSQDTATGFRLTAKPHQSPCGPSVLNATASTQVLTSPNYPDNYPVNIHCQWLIVADWFASVVNLYFETFDIEDSPGCLQDRLEILDNTLSTWSIPDGFPMENNVFAGRSSYSQSTPSKHSYCGASKPPEIYSMSHRLAISFISDSQATNKGFKLHYATVGCNRNYSEPQGRILFQRQKDTCVITITTDLNKTISVYFNKISLYRQTACVAKLEIFENNKKAFGVCGYNKPPPFFSKSNKLTIKISGNGKNSASADISYTTTDQGEGCGGTFYSTTGSFTSPSYPGNFRNFSYCCWQVTVPRPNTPRVTFDEFDLGIKSTCGTDYVELFDINSENGGKVLRTKYCGGDKPADFVGNGQSVAVCYKTSIHNSGIGWSAVFNSHTDQNSVQPLHVPAPFRYFRRITPRV